MKKRTVQWGLVLTVVLAGGCGQRQTNSLWNDVDRLKQENTALSLETQTLRRENDRLNQQVRTLSGLDGPARLEALDTLAAVKLHPRTGLYDTNEDGTDETLMVYLQPVDTAGDQVKTVGQVTVQVWNLDTDAGDALLLEQTFEPDAIRDAWGGNIFGSYYRLPVDIGGHVAGDEEELTVKVTFTDYLAGSVLRDQTTVTP